MKNLELNKIHQGDSIEILKMLPNESIDCVITSPPYWGLRDYGTANWEGGDENCNHKLKNNLKENKGDWERPSRKESNKVGELLRCPVCGNNFISKIGTKFCSKKCLNTLSNNDREKAESKRIDICICGAKRIDNQIGLEKTPEEYVAKLVELFREVKRVLKKEGTLWLNLGDTYSAARWSSGVGQPMNKMRDTHRAGEYTEQRESNLPTKNLVGIPWRVAFALQADGWYLRQDIIWAKPNPMPESVTDRCTKSHEYIFLLSKSPKYYFDNEAIKERVITNENRPAGIVRDREYGYDSKQAILRNRNKDGRKDGTVKGKGDVHKTGTRSGGKVSAAYKGVDWGEEGRNKRDVWNIATMPYSEAHFATFPEKLIEPMVMAGCPVGGVILDPFMGAGTTGLVAKKFNRNYAGCELNPAYIKIAKERIGGQTLPLL